MLTGSAYLHSLGLIGVTDDISTRLCSQEVRNCINWVSLMSLTMSLHIMLTASAYPHQLGLIGVADDVSSCLRSQVVRTCINWVSLVSLMMSLRVYSHRMCVPAITGSRCPR
jgi:hypothetical protein